MFEPNEAAKCVICNLFYSELTPLVAVMWGGSAKRPEWGAGICSACEPLFVGDIRDAR
jgi:hypothetical protein